MHQSWKRLLDIRVFSLLGSIARATGGAVGDVADCSPTAAVSIRAFKPLWYVAAARNMLGYWAQKGLPGWTSLPATLRPTGRIAVERSIRQAWARITGHLVYNLHPAHRVHPLRAGHLLHRTEVSAARQMAKHSVLLCFGASVKSGS